MSTSGISPEEWDQIRERFATSIMADTELHKLAQNIDASWPNRGGEETPRKYLEDDYNTLLARPEIAGKEDRVALLAAILEETLAFDDPFGDMAEYVDSSSSKDEGAFRTLEKLEIPKDFPLRFSALDDDSMQFCRTEKLETLGEFVEFAQSMAQNIVVGGDFRKLLNCLSHIDEETIAELLPYRKGHQGLHLIEALALLGKTLSPKEKKTLCSEAGTLERGFSFHPGATLGQKETDRLLDRLEAEAKERMTYFANGKDSLEKALHEGGSALQRYMMVLNDPEKEALAISLARLAIAWESRKKGGFFSRLFKR